MSETLLMLVLLAGGAVLVALAFSVGRQVGLSERGEVPDPHAGQCPCGEEWFREDESHDRRGPHGPGTTEG